ncbi:MAG TPA: helix-turn-helix transcriptional regulator [Solirubrobacterales bacterium]|nr:helix-turn-helix transcriptional regulator [Solirubrobacterales bacterium]
MPATADQPRTSLAEQLREGRRTAGLTQAEFADRAGVSLATVQRFEQGYEPQGRSHAARIIRQTLVDLAA